MRKVWKVVLHTIIVLFTLSLIIASITIIVDAVGIIYKRFFAIAAKNLFSKDGFSYFLYCIDTNPETFGFEIKVIITLISLIVWLFGFSVVTILKNNNVIKQFISTQKIRFQSYKINKIKRKKEKLETKLNKLKSDE